MSKPTVSSSAPSSHHWWDALRRWHVRARERAEIAQLGDAELRDLGITRSALLMTQRFDARDGVR